MKNKISPATAIIIIVVVLVIVIAVGWFAVMRPDSGSTSDEEIDIQSLDQATMKNDPAMQGQAPPLPGGEGAVAP